jgi:hypothetical protein
MTNAVPSTKEGTRLGRIFARTEREREEEREGRSLVPASGNRLVNGGGSEKL